MPELPPAKQILNFWEWECKKANIESHSMSVNNHGTEVWSSFKYSTDSRSFFERCKPYTD
ncbi:unnamed protein product [Coffea canephora]|uniref:Uncharacterized protein n=1 Tax=Coffea canephora TaxID=49390 RepID=A0A068TM35_COFCA|nr:unnamed protein product [Coffea canephora]